MSMSLLDRLNQRAPRDVKYLNLCRAHGPIFAEAAERYLNHTSGASNNGDPSKIAFLHKLASKLVLREESAVGALIRAQQVDDEAEAAHYGRRAEKNAQFAVIFAFAMKKVAARQSSDSEIEINPFADRIIENILKCFEGYEPATRLYGALSAAQQRGWAAVSPETPLPTLIGANWCPDTANLAEIANALRIPIVILFSDYIQPVEDKGRRKHGIFQLQDHAQAVYEDGFEKPSIPIVRYPNRVTQFEPRLFQFVEQLAENGLI